MKIRSAKTSEVDGLTGVAKEAKHRIEAALAGGLIRLSRVVPLRVLLRVGSGIGWLAFRVVRLRRSLAMDHIRRSLPGIDRKEADRIGERAYRNLGRSFMELIAFGALSKEKIMNMVTIEGSEHLDAALDHGRGAILFTGHFGNWELLGAVVAQEGYPLHVTDTSHSNPHTHRLLSEMRIGQGMKIIEPSRPVIYLLDLLATNQFVAYLPDQDARGAGLFVDFLGRPAWTLRAPAVFSVRKRCPMLPGFLIRERFDHHRAIFLPLLWPDPKLPPEEAVFDLTKRYTRVIEEMIRHHPDHYFWLHRRWKTRPDSG